MSAAQLKQECENANLPKSGSKAQLVEHLINYIDIILPTNAEACFEKDLEAAISTSATPHHNFYRNNFNHVDLHNRRFYKWFYRFKINDWTAKMVLSVLTDMVTNAWAAYCEKNEIKLKDFRTKLAKELMEFESF